MFYKGIIFDLDNTIYDYDFSHEIAIQTIFQYLLDNYKIPINESFEKYDECNKKLKFELNHTASSHNKSIYFKHIIEHFVQNNYFLLPLLNELYWNTFYKNMKCFEGVIEFILWNRKNGIKIGILTDYETEYQIIKLQKLALLDFVDVIVTSEEVGIEKPSIQMFQTILNKMDLLSSEVIMIGDNYEKDICGANNANIFSYWFHKNINFIYLLEKMKDIQNELKKFSELSRFCGERFDLVQAGGGNISCKVNGCGWMFIKASGYHLTNVTNSSGYSIINNAKLLKDIQNDNINSVTDYNIINKIRPSIETFMHSILKKYTVHLHPIQVNRILISDKAEEIIKELFLDEEEILFISYLTPGIKVCNEIKSKYKDEKIIFLKNHGIIITSDNYEEIYVLLEKVINTFEKYQNLNFEKYKITNILSKYINDIFGINNISYLCENVSINNYFCSKLELFHERITCPDILIYCGIEIAKLEELLEYKQKYNESPKIIIFNNNIYINGINMNKCRDIEDVLLSNLIILDSNYNKDYLSKDEIYYLNNWDAEKYRKKI